MTSEQNKLLPILRPKEVIGTTRRPNRRDLRARDNLQGLPDPTPETVLRRSALDLSQAALRIQQTAIEMTNNVPETSLRASLTVLADPEAAGWSDPDWETVTERSEGPDEEEAEKAEAEEREVENAFIAKMSGMEAWEVRAARVRPVGLNVPAFVARVRAVQRRRGGARVTAPAAQIPPPQRPSSSPTNLQPGTTSHLTTAQAALALTNAQAGTNVTMDDLHAMDEVADDDDAETYAWTVGGVSTRNLTVAEAALVLTNAEAGTEVTMQDLRTAREMVDLWDDEDVFQWTVGNVE